MAQACARYPHRYTMTYVPAWARNPQAGKFYAPQYRDCSEWYASTLFPGEGGIPRNEKYCQSNGQTWPLGQWLDKPFTMETN